MDVLDKLSKGVRWLPGEEIPFPIGLPTVVLKHLQEAIAYISDSETRDPQQLGRKVQGPLYHLYRLLQAASSMCLGSTSLNEDGLTLAFMRELQVVANKAKQIRTDFSLEIRQHPVMLHLLPALQEQHIGADLVLLLAGKELLGHHGAKAFWIQAKRPTDSSFNLKIAQNNAECKFRQASKLFRMDSPQAGSHALYLLHGHRISNTGADALWTAEARLVLDEGGDEAQRLRRLCEHGQFHVPEKPAVCALHAKGKGLGIPSLVDITNAVCRIQEHIPALIKYCPNSQFTQVTGFKQFLKNRIAVPLPTKIVGISAQGNKKAAHLLDQMSTAVATALYKQNKVKAPPRPRRDGQPRPLRK